MKRLLYTLTAGVIAAIALFAAAETAPETGKE